MQEYPYVRISQYLSESYISSQLQTTNVAIKTNEKL